MSRPCYLFRPNPHDSSHMAAWEALQNVPPGQRNRYIVRAVLKMQEDTALEETLRRVLREEMQSGRLFQPVSSPELPDEDAPAGQGIPQEMMGFLDGLMREE